MERGKSWAKAVTGSREAGTPAACPKDFVERETASRNEERSKGGGSRACLVAYEGCPWRQELGGSMQSLPVRERGRDSQIFPKG